MSVSRCMDQALRIARQPRSGWKAAIAVVREACPHVDCSAGPGCRARVADYLRVQWHMAAARDQREAAAVPRNLR